MKKEGMSTVVIIFVIFAIFLVFCFSSKADFTRLKYKDSRNPDEWFVYVNDEEYIVKQADARVKVSLKSSEKTREMELVLPFVYSSYGEWKIPDEYLTELAVKYEWVEPAKQGGSNPFGVNMPLQRLHITSEKEEGEFCVEQPTEAGTAVVWIEYVFE